MKAYPEYKPSGIEWLGQLPSHWTTYAFKWMFSTSTGITFTKSDLTKKGHPVISYGQIHNSQNNGVSVKEALLRYIPDSIVLGKEDAMMVKGDFLFADTSEDLDGCGNSVYIDVDYPIYAGYHSIICRPFKEVHGKYLAYLFKTDVWRLQIRSRVYGVKVFSITQTILSQTSLILPPSKEQEKIAEYLDDVTGKVDALITEKKRQVEDLRRYRTSLITETVTHGLNPTAPFINSEIEWLGKIPYHWKLAKFKYAVSEIKDGTHFSPETCDEGYAYVTATDIRGVGIDYQKTKKISESNFLKLRQIGCEILRDDVLLVKDGATTGRVGYKDDDTLAVTLSSVAILRSSKEGFPKYLMYLLESAMVQSQISDAMAGAAMPRITLEKLGNFICIIPPLSEQKDIAMYLDEKTGKIDTLITEFEKQLEDLALYKKAVITEAVTGKVDVRDWTPNNRE